MPCPGSNCVDGITWYSPNFTQPGEFAFCGECYNQFIRNTPLNVYMRNDGIQSGNCDFSSNVKQQWLIAVSRNDINIFRGYVEPRLGHIRELRDRMDRLQVILSQELQRKEFLIISQHNYNIMASTSKLRLGGDEPSYGYSFKGSRYNSSSSVEAARIQIQIDESSRIFNNYLAEMRLLEHEISNS
ncbi:18655_t:CDS:1, partial [Gigaspora margarita]